MPDSTAYAELVRAFARPPPEDIKALPPILYHGTTADRLRPILEGGLLPSTPTTRVHADYAESTEGYISFSQRETEARFFALAAAVEYRERTREEIDGVVFKVQTAIAQRCWNTRFFRVDALRGFNRGAQEWVTPDVVCNEAVQQYFIIPLVGAKRNRGKKVA